MKRSDVNHQVLVTEERELLWHANTPQMYPLKQLKDALGLALEQEVSITDESSAIEWAGQPSYVVAGRDDNIKITRPNDLKLASFYLAQQREENQQCE
jgi:2-C-methyl-D-erythritol 4-phosphate cytidylyltransferase